MRERFNFPCAVKSADWFGTAARSLFPRRKTSGQNRKKSYMKLCINGKRRLHFAARIRTRSNVLTFAQCALVWCATVVFVFVRTWICAVLAQNIWVKVVKRSHLLNALFHRVRPFPINRDDSYGLLKSKQKRRNTLWLFARAAVKKLLPA